MQAPEAEAAIAWLRTLLAKGPAPLRREHLRRQPANRAVPALHLIVLDTSGSMRQRGRLALAKGYAVRLIEQARRAGDDVGLLSFGGAGIELLLPPAQARSAGALRVRACGGGGGTPMTQALAMAQALLAKRSARRRQDSTMWLLTDGRTLEQPPAPAAAGHIVIVNFGHPGRPLGRCAAWARDWQAELRPAPFTDS
jgi:magnesium chelatase subunit ChlD-like protein